MKKLLKRIFNPDGKSMTSDENEMIEKLILNGALEVAGVDSEDGSLLYSFTSKIEQVMPELYHDHLNRVNAEILSLWERGYVDLEELRSFCTRNNYYCGTINLVNLNDCDLFLEESLSSTLDVGDNSSNSKYILVSKNYSYEIQ